jgi:actin related protein 2/3 complex, subunit 2
VTVTIKFDCEKIAEADKEDFVEKVSNLKLHCESGPMVAAFTALGQGGKAGPVITLNYRKSESLYICPRDGKVVVIMMLDFEDMTEKAMAKTFLSEFVEAQRMIRNAPSVAYGIKPPGELSGVKGIEKLTNVDIAGFISFAVEPRHVAGKHMGKTVALLSGFRNYLSYHIKCSKTYLHMRMRHRMDEWMKVLNRAQPHVEGEKKTFAGKTFRR